MANSLLDALPPHSWFFGFGLYISSIIIAIIGIIHPVAYVYSFRRRGDKYRDDYQFLVSWFMTAFWFFFSVLLFLGIVLSWELAYEAWIWFTFLFSISMSLVWGAILYQYFYCTQRRPLPPKFFFLLSILLFYLMTIYFIFVVNSLRMHVFSNKRQDSKSLEAQVSPVTLLPDMF